MPLLSGAEALLKSLELHGVETIFGLPGGQLDHFFLMSSTRLNTAIPLRFGPIFDPEQDARL